MLMMEKNDGEIDDEDELACFFLQCCCKIAVAHWTVRLLMESESSASLCHRNITELERRTCWSVTFHLFTPETIFLWPLRGDDRVFTTETHDTSRTPMLTWRCKKISYSKPSYNSSSFYIYFTLLISFIYLKKKTCNWIILDS